VTVTTDTNLSTPQNLTSSSTGCAKFIGFVSRDGAFDDISLPHGTYIAGIMAGKAPIWYQNQTEATWWEGIASGANLFVMKMFSTTLTPTMYVPTSLEGFLQWVCIFI
jgi:hypothetical protein